MAWKLLKWVRDTTVPTLTVCTMASNGTDTTRAKVGDIITLTITASENIQDPIVTIATGAAQVTRVSGNTQFTAVYTMTSATSNGAIDFTVDFTDINGNAWTQVTAVTSGSAVTFDKTAPTLSSATRTNNTTLDVVLSELAVAATITKSNAGGFVVYETGTPATTYAVSAIAPGSDNTHVVLTVASIAASQAQGVTVTYVAGGNGTVADRAYNALATDATGVAVAAW